jgi:hypothetical protein
MADTTQEHALIAAAIAKHYSKVAADLRDSLEPGTYEVDEEVTLTAKGWVTVGEDTTKASTSSIPLLPALALVVKRLGAQRERALTLLREVVTEAMEMDESARAHLLEETGVGDAMELVKREVVAKLPRTPVRGSVKFVGEIKDHTNI